MLARRFMTRPVAVVAQATALRFKSEQEDDRWFEAEIAEKEKTPEERYAAEEQAKLLKKMMQRMRTETKEAVAESHASKQHEVELLKKHVADLNAKIDELKK